MWFLCNFYVNYTVISIVNFIVISMACVCSIFFVLRLKVWIKGKLYSNIQNRVFLPVTQINSGDIIWQKLFFCHSSCTMFIKLGVPSSSWIFMASLSLFSIKWRMWDCISKIKTLCLYGQPEHSQIIKNYNKE